LIKINRASRNEDFCTRIRADDKNPSQNARVR